MRVPRWTTSLVCAGLLGAVLSGCRSRENAFRSSRVPVARFDSVLKTADSVRLPLADARLLLAVAADSTFALKAPHDTMTMTDILAWAHAEQARKAQVDAATLAAERARQDSVRKLLEPLLVVTVVKKTYLPRNPDSEQYGDSIYSAHLKVDLPLTPGQTRREPARIVRVNPFRVAHQRLRDTPLEKMKLVWQTSDVVFADGNRLSLSAP